MQKQQPIAFRMVGAGLKLGAASARRLDQVRPGGFGDDRDLFPAKASVRTVKGYDRPARRIG